MTESTSFSDQEKHAVNALFSYLGIDKNTSYEQAQNVLKGLTTLEGGQTAMGSSRLLNTILSSEKVYVCCQQIEQNNRGYTFEGQTQASIEFGARAASFSENINLEKEKLEAMSFPALAAVISSNGSAAEIANYAGGSRVQFVNEKGFPKSAVMVKAKDSPNIARLEELGFGEKIVTKEEAVAAYSEKTMSMLSDGKVPHFEKGGDIHFIEDDRIKAVASKHEWRKNQEFAKNAGLSDELFGAVPMKGNQQLISRSGELKTHNHEYLNFLSELQERNPESFKGEIGNVETQIRRFFKKQYIMGDEGPFNFSISEGQPPKLSLHMREHAEKKVQVEKTVTSILNNPSMASMVQVFDEKGQQIASPHQNMQEELTQVRDGFENFMDKTPSHEVPGEGAGFVEKMGAKKPQNPQDKGLQI